jgi:RNA polymerase sigma factor (sigma-70 family)
MVSNEEYESALKNKDNIMIMHSAGSSFITVLDEDEIHRCKLIALWEALQAWRPNRGSKFTAFLYQRVYWECLKCVKFNNKNRDVQVEFIDREVLPDTPIEEVLEILPDDLQDIIKKRYVYGMTLREIGDEHGYSYETARKKLKKASNCMKVVYN